MSRNERIVVVDIGAESVKLACFVPVRAGGVELASFGVRTLPPEAADAQQRSADITEAVADLARAQGALGSAALIGVPGQSVFSRFVKLPPVGRDKVRQIVLHEAQQNVPFPINEVVWDHQLIGEGVGELDVMIAAIKTEAIEEITDAVEAAGLRPELVDVEPMAIYNAVRYNYNELPACTLVLDIGARSTDLIFIEANRVFNRSIPVGGHAITQQIMKGFDLPEKEAEQLKRQHAFVAFGGAYESHPSEVADKASRIARSFMTRLHTEISRSINFYRTQQAGGAPGLALLAGGSSILPHADAFLKEKLNLEVEFFNPFQNVSVARHLDAEDVAAQAHLLGGVVGIALRRSGLPCPIEINLLPPRIAERQRFVRKQPFFILSAAFAVFTLVVWAFYFSTLRSLGEKRLINLRQTVAALEAVETRLRRYETRMDALTGKGRTLATLAANRAVWLNLLHEAHRKLPDGMWISHMRPEFGEAEAPPNEALAFGAPPASADAARDLPPRPLRAVLLSGYGYLDKATAAGAIRFRDALRQSPIFTLETEVVEAPVARPDDYAFQFTIRIFLKEPVSL